MASSAGTVASITTEDLGDRSSQTQPQPAGLGLTLGKRVYYSDGRKQDEEKEDGRHNQRGRRDFVDGGINVCAAPSPPSNERMAFVDTCTEASKRGEVAFGALAVPTNASTDSGSSNDEFQCNSNSNKDCYGCQAEGCLVDLSAAKSYYRRHRVCETHAKATTVAVASVQQRFCQQCSKFHMVSEFDGEKRSCRKKLADHNQRRRKCRSPQHAAPMASCCCSCMCSTSITTGPFCSFSYSQHCGGLRRPCYSSGSSKPWMSNYMNVCPMPAYVGEVSVAAGMQACKHYVPTAAEFHAQQLQHTHQMQQQLQEEGGYRHRIGAPPPSSVAS